MATEIDFHHQNPRSVSVSEMLDHGSVSFGRFTSESLAWEKWSVFSHNRYQEELQKFSFAGFVAQKKAYFEDYYRKVRTAKALLTAESSESTSQIARAEVGNDAGITKDETKEATNDIQGSENGASMGSDKQEADINEVLLTPGTGRSGISQLCQVRDSDLTERVASKSITQGNAAPARSIAKRESRCKKEKTNPSPHETGRVVLGKSRILKAENRNNYDKVSSGRSKRCEPFSGSTILHPSMTRNKLMSSFDGKSSQQKTNSKVRDSTDKFRRSVPLNKQSPQSSLKKLGYDDLLWKGTDNSLKNPTPRNEVNLKSIGPSRKICDRETNKVEGENKISVTTRRASMSSATAPSRNHENLKPIHKGTKLTVQAQAQRVEARNKMPTWR